MSADITLSKAKISKVTQSDGSFGSWSGNLGKIVILNYGVYFARDKLLRLVSIIASNAASNAMNKFQRRIIGKEAVKAGKGFTLFTSIEDINDIIKIKKLLE